MELKHLDAIDDAHGAAYKQAEEWKKRGDAATKAQRYDEAIACYDAGLAVATGFGILRRRLHLNLSLCAWKLGLMERALAEAQAAASPEWPKDRQLDTKAHLRVATAQLALGQYEEACASVAEARSLSPGDRAVYKLSADLDDVYLPCMLERCEVLLDDATGSIPVLEGMSVVAAIKGDPPELASLLVLRPREPTEGLIAPEFRSTGFRHSVTSQQIRQFICSVDQCQVRSGLLVEFFSRLVGARCNVPHAAGRSRAYEIVAARRVCVQLLHDFNPVMCNPKMQALVFPGDRCHNGPPTPLLNDAPHVIVELHLSRQNCPHRLYIDLANKQASGPLGEACGWWWSSKWPKGYRRKHTTVDALPAISFEELRRIQSQGLPEYVSGHIPSIISEVMDRLNATFITWADRLRPRRSGSN